MTLVDAISSLQQGGVIAYPTEAVYGLGCDPDNELALQRLLTIKHRDPKKGLILIAANWAMLSKWIGVLTEEQRKKVAGVDTPTSWVFPVESHLFLWLSGAHASLAVRVTTHPVAKALSLGFGKPIVSTSANPESLAAARSHTEVENYFGRNIDGILEGDLGSYSKPSEIRDITTNHIIRF